MKIKYYLSKLSTSLKMIKVPVFFKNMFIHHKYILLAIIVTLAILIFGKITTMREGFEHQDEKMTSSYVAPAGNTVLYMDDSDMNDTDMKDTDMKEHREKKYRKKENKHMQRQSEIGIPRSQIPPGNEDLYILKSEVIPPVCPACPNITVCPKCNGNGNGNGNGSEPPPCPPCARCPEPSFDCKKVPNYNRNDSDFLPRPVLADFSQFGM
jgi:hypothetical protein